MWNSEELLWGRQRPIDTHRIGGKRGAARLCDSLPLTGYSHAETLAVHRKRVSSDLPEWLWPDRRSARAIANSFRRGHGGAGGFAQAWMGMFAEALRFQQPSLKLQPSGGHARALGWHLHEFGQINIEHPSAAVGGRSQSKRNPNAPATAVRRAELRFAAPRRAMFE
jgi:hypothetical protein